MSRMGSFQAADLWRLKRKLDQLQAGDAQTFVEACAKELAARLLQKVIKRTPVGDYSREIEVVAKRDSKHHKKGDIYKKRVNPSGKEGGTLRRGWTCESHAEAASGSGKSAAADAKAYVDSLTINHIGNLVVVELVNPVEYASYVEFGHRTRNHGWVEGRFMLTKSEQELRDIAPQVLERKIKKFLLECIE